MRKLATTKLSSKGQIVIPDEIRQSLNLKTGMQFVVIGAEDVVILKIIHTPSMDEFNELISRARIQASKAGLEEKDIEEVIRKVRDSK